MAAYLAHGVKEGCKASTLGRRVAAIRYAHKLASLPTPTDFEAVKATLRGIRRSIGAAKEESASGGWIASRPRPGGLPRHPKRQARPGTDAAGVLGAFRRSELVALDVEHLDENQPRGCASTSLNQRLTRKPRA